MHWGCKVANIPSLDDLQKMYEESGGEGEVTSSVAKSSSKSKKVKVKPPPVVKGTEVSVEDDSAYCDIHFWLRDRDNWNAVLQDSKTEASIRSQAVLVYAHNHTRNQPCNHLCRHIKGE